MNKRMQQLAAQALDQVVPYTWTRLDYDEIQKLQQCFAELIVRECVDVADHSNVTGKSIVGERIKQHFGVKQ